LHDAISVTMQYRFFNGNPIDDVRLYIENYIQSNPTSEIFIGTDSHAHKDQLTFVTTICFHKPINGVHCIYSKHIELKPKELYTRIWREVELTYEIAELVKPVIGKKTLFLDVDVNVKPQHPSNVVYGAAYGFLNANGYSVRFKPQAYATHAADWLLR